LSARAQASWRLARALLLPLLPLLLACGGEDSGDHLRRGEEYYQSGQYEEARLEGLNVLSREPEQSGALWLVGRSLLGLNRDSEAEGYLRSLMEAKPEFRPLTAALFDSMAVADYGAGRRQRAAERWELSLEFDPETDLGPYGFFQARHFFKKRDWESSTKLYLRANGAYPDSSAVEGTLFPLAQGLVKLGRWEEAREQLVHFLNVAPKHPSRNEAIFLYQEVLLRLAKADGEMLDFEGALDKLGELLRYRANPGKIEEALLEKGRCLEELGRYREAADTYRKLIDSSDSGRGRAFEAALGRLQTLEKARLK